MTNEQRRVREIARAEGFHRGSALTYGDVARWLPASWDPSFIANQCELAGFPVWTSAPSTAF